jgi:hypothetical protein
VLWRRRPASQGCWEQQQQRAAAGNVSKRRSGWREEFLSSNQTDPWRRSSLTLRQQTDPWRTSSLTLRQHAPALQLPP